MGNKMSKKGGKKRVSPRKTYARKAQQKRNTHAPEESIYETPEQPYSMTDAARNTEQRRSWGRQNLRHTRIEFVNGTEDSKPADSLVEGRISSKAAHFVCQSEPTDYNHEEQNEDTQRLHISTKKDSCSSTIDLKPNEDTFTAERTTPVSNTFLDKTDEKPSDAHWSDTIRVAESSGSRRKEKLSRNYSEASAASSDSSEEVILFTGRRSAIQTRKVASLLKEERNSLHYESMRIPEQEKLRGAQRISRSSQIKSRSSPQPVLMPADEGELFPTEDPAVIDYITNLLEHETLEILGQSAEEQGSKSRSSVEYSQQTAVTEGVQESEVSDGSLGDDLDSADISPDDAKLQRAAHEMTDEAIAKRLAKQEELGLSSNSIVLWHEDDLAGIESDCDEFNIEVLRDAAREFTGFSRSMSRKKAKKINRHFTDQPELSYGEDYGEFDIMDLERPSLQRNRQRHDGLGPDVSGDGIETRLKAAWENDRAKKKRRKETKEQSRIDASFTTPNDNSLSIVSKHTKSLSAEELKLQIHDFILSEQIELQLVPMDKRARRAIHEIAVRLNMRSKSKGGGQFRFPCLFKTSRTTNYNQGTIDAVLTRYGFRNSNNNLGMKDFTRRRIWKDNSRHTGGGVTSGVSYKDGDTVGGDAPALGAENKGHSLLSKMGWQTGTALGAMNNKGSLEPVAHIVKVTRSGLG